MIVLTFKVTGTDLIRTDMNRLVAVSRNNVAAKFDFNSDWEGITPLAAQFSKDDNTCYDVFIENGECIVPWEVLESSGILTVTVFGGDLLTTSSVNINVYGNGLVGGLTPTAASPGIYTELYNRVENMEEDFAKKTDVYIENTFLAPDYGYLYRQDVGSVTAEYDIGNYTFCRSSVESLYVKDNLAIGNCAFMECEKLKTVTIKPYGAMLRDYAFLGCINLNEVYIESDVDNQIILPNNIFSGCTSLSKVTLRGYIIGINRFAFENCTGLTKIEIPKETKLIEAHAFRGCTNLKTIIVNNAEASITGAPWGAVNAEIIWNGGM